MLLIICAVFIVLYLYPTITELIDDNFRLDDIAAI